MKLPRYPPLRSVRLPQQLRFRIPDFRQKFDALFSEGQPITLEGRITNIRQMLKKTFFFDIVQDNAKVQVLATVNATKLDADKFREHFMLFNKNDAVHASGTPHLTGTGELLLKLDGPMISCSPSVREPPSKLIDRSQINTRRVAHYISLQQARKVLEIKSKVLQLIRQYFLSRDFIEVQTPLLAESGTGANATPFITRSKALEEDQELQLRVAPEIWLKKLVIGGFDKVFEIGQNFRNEGIDGTHNPEFTSCEFYQTWTDLNELMNITDELFNQLNRDVGSPIEFKPILKYEFVPTLEKITGVTLPSSLDQESLLMYFEKLALPVPAVKSPLSLLDTLCSTYLEPLSQDNQPVFIYNQPAELSPLAKSTEIEYEGGRRYDISLRFEMFINGREYVNAYEEENSPETQKQKFELQQRAKSEYLDEESQIPDWHYIEDMKYGLPPTGGWGCGIDRLVMLFANVSRIEDVLSFGNLRDVIRQ